MKKYIIIFAIMFSYTQFNFCMQKQLTDQDKVYLYFIRNYTKNQQLLALVKQHKDLFKKEETIKNLFDSVACAKRPLLMQKQKELLTQSIQAVLNKSFLQFNKILDGLSIIKHDLELTWDIYKSEVENHEASKQTMETHLKELFNS